MQELLMLLMIILVSALFSYKSSKLKVATVAIITNYLMLLVYWGVGIYLTDEYEPEMVIGWFIFAELSLATLMESIQPEPHDNSKE